MLFVLTSVALAQDADTPPPADLSRRAAFAEMYVGADIRALQALGSSQSADGLSGRPQGLVQPRLWIGASHFWGHADIYVAFAVPPSWVLGPAPEGLDAARVYSGVETGAKVFPWALEPNTLRLWASVAWTPITYRQWDPELGRGPSVEKHLAEFGLGVSRRQGAHTVELGVSGAWRRLDYASSPSQSAALEMPIAAVHLGYKFNFDTTASIVPAAESGHLAERAARQTQAGADSAFNVALGASSAMSVGLTRSGSDIQTAPRPPSSIFPELGVGYYIALWDAALRLSARQIRQSASAYEAEQTWARRTLSLEAFKMLGDYHGFVPFLGLGLGVNGLSYSQGGSLPAAGLETLQLRPELVFGWDIRPTDSEVFILRTNLRLNPLTTADSGTLQVSFQHLEFNFIQLVVYPGRVAAHRSAG